MSRVALVTGGMGGLGEAVCIKLAALGFKVVTTYSPGNAKYKPIEPAPGRYVKERAV